jgi:hypothetical protein
MKGNDMRRSFIVSCAGILTGVLLFGSNTDAQVFPPRQPHPVTPPPAGAPPNQPLQPAPLSPPAGPPGSFSRVIPFVAILGDPTKSFIQIGNMRSPVDTNFVLGRGLAGRVSLDKYTHEGGNGKRSFLHVHGTSNPPLVTTEANELKLHYVVPTLQFKTFYQEYTGEADNALTDVVAENVTIDVFLSPTVDQRRLPTFVSARVVVSGTIKEAEKCMHFFDVVFPVNVCKLAEEYFRQQVKPAIENGMHEILLQPQTRMQFEQQVYQFVRADLLAQAGLNPMSPAQVQILQANFHGTDYVAQYISRP